MADVPDKGVEDAHIDPRKPRVERWFEVSRLENELLARAYEQVVPVSTRTCAASVLGAFEGAARLNDYSLSVGRSCM